jgi:hypothetical protein
MKISKKKAPKLIQTERICKFIALKTETYRANRDEQKTQVVLTENFQHHLIFGVRPRTDLKGASYAFST